MENKRDINVIDNNINSLYQSLDKPINAFHQKGAATYSDMVLEGRSPKAIKRFLEDHYTTKFNRANAKNERNNEKVNERLIAEKEVRREAIISEANAQETHSNPINKRIGAFISLLTMSVTMFLASGCGANKIGGQDKIQDLEEATIEVLLEGYEKGLYNDLIFDGDKVLVDEIKKDVTETLDYQILVRSIAGDALALLNQEGEMTAAEVINGSLQFEHSLLNQALKSTDHVIDYSKIYINEGEIDLATRANSIVNRMNIAVANENYGDFNLSAEENDPESLAALVDEAIALKNELITSIPSNPTLASDYAILLILRMQDYINFSGKEIINLNEERIFDQPISTCMDKIFATVKTKDEIIKIAKDMGVEVDYNKEKDEVIADITSAVQMKYGLAKDFMAFTSIIRNQYYGAVFGERIDNSIKIKNETTFSQADAKYAYDALIERITDYLVKLIDKGKLDQTVFDYDFWINFSKVGINKAFLVTENGVITQTGSYITYSVKKERVSKDEVPAYAQVPDVVIPNPGRKGKTDKEAEEAYKKASRDAVAQAGSTGKDPDIPDDLPDDERAQVERDIKDAQKAREDEAKKQPEVTEVPNPNPSEEVVSIIEKGGEAINGNASSPSDTYNGVPNTDLTLNGAIVPMEFYDGINDELYEAGLSNQGPSKRR